MVKKLKNASILYGLVLIIAGLVLTFFPEITAKSIAYTIGIVAIIIGAFFIIRYFHTQPGYIGENRGLVSGFVVIIFGILIFVKSEMIISIIPIILGFIVTTSGLNTLQQGIDLARVNGKGWGAVILMAVINIVVGVVVLCNPFSTATLLIRIIGIGMVYSGITDILISLYLSKQIKKYYRKEENNVSENIIDEEES